MQNHIVFHNAFKIRELMLSASSIRTAQQVRVEYALSVILEPRIPYSCVSIFLSNPSAILFSTFHKTL